MNHALIFEQYSSDFQSDKIRNNLPNIKLRNQIHDLCTKNIPMKNIYDRLTNSTTKRQMLIKCIHIVKPNMKQIYVAKDLHKTPHYTINCDDIHILEAICSYCDVQCYIYTNNKSYIQNQNYLTVINSNTLFWTDTIELIYQQLQRNNIIYDVFQNFHDNKHFDMKRNNYQVSAGYSVQSFTQISRQEVAKPRLLKLSHNLLICKSMETMTKICDILHELEYIDEPLFYDMDRNAMFANLISKKNRLEGFTIARQNKNMNLLGYHIDKNNCRMKSYNSTIGVVSLHGDERVVYLGYGKKVCHDYILRQKR